MTLAQEPYKNALRQAQIALRLGDYQAARTLAQKAAVISPEYEDPWLILAAVANPRASLIYLKQALDINPNSSRARKGMHWAIQRLRAEQSFQQAQSSHLIPDVIPSKALIRRKAVVYPWLILVLLVGIIIIGWFGYPTLFTAYAKSQTLAIAQLLQWTTDTPTASATQAFTATSTSTLTFTPSATHTNTPTNTESPTSTETILPSATPIQTETITPLPSDTPIPLPEEDTPAPTIGPNGKFNLPAVEPSERWIDVDLSQQRVYAFEGDQLVRMFIVSTGLPRTPTVIGLFRIYVKYRSATMSGPGYYLPDVPYTMYFYKDYGLHGTYWHHNFGHPMSHGCVNLKTKDAKWLFEWASVGTFVNVHK